MDGQLDIHSPEFIDTSSKNFRLVRLGHSPINQPIVIQVEPPPVPSLERVGSSFEQVPLHARHVLQAGRAQEAVLRIPIGVRLAAR